MWIRRIELEGFGNRREFSLGGLQRALNIILGANETGKSTLVEAVCCGLFGFPTPDPRNGQSLTGTRSRLRVYLELVQRNRKIIRIDRTLNGHGEQVRVTDRLGSSLDPAYLDVLTGGVDRRHYANAFAFALDELQHLGTLSATAVQSRIVGASFGSLPISPQEAIDTLEAKAKELWSSPRGRADRLRSELAEVETTLAELEEFEREMVEQEMELAAGQRRIEELRKELEALGRETLKCQRVLDFEELAAKVRAEREALYRLSAPGQITARSLERFQVAQAEREQTSERTDRVEAELAAVEGKLSSLSAEDNLTQVESQIHQLDQRSALYAEHFQKWQEVGDELAAAEATLEAHLAQHGSGWSQERLSASRVAGSELDALVQLCQDVIQLRRSLGLERMRLSQVLQQQAPRDRRLLIPLAFAGSALILFGLLGFLGGPSTGMLTMTVSVLLATALLAWGLRVRVPTNAPIAQERQQLAEVEAALKGQFPARPTLPLVIHLAKIQGELEAQRARLELPLPAAPEDMPQVLRDLRLLNDTQHRILSLRELRTSLDTALTRDEGAAAEVARHCRLKPPGRGELAPFIHRLQERLTRAQTLGIERRELEGQREKLGAELQTLSSARREAQRRIRTLVDKAGVEDEEAFLRMAATAAEHEEKSARLEALEQALAQKAAEQDMEDWYEAAPGEGRPSTRQRLAQTQQRQTALRAELDQLMEQQGELEERRRRSKPDRELLAARERRAALRQELAHTWEQALVHRMGAAVLRRAKERYEQEQQGPVLERASELFCTITGGRYQRLRMPFGESGLEVVRSDSHTVADFDTLSRGTREELYLAVRLAYLAEICTHAGEPLPVLLDDVLVNADPERAARALSAIAELSGATQILFCTCHPHLAALLGRSAPVDGQAQIELSQPWVPAR